MALTGFVLLLALLLGNSSGNYAAQSRQKTSAGLNDTLQKMIVQNGSVTMDLDLNRLNGLNASTVLTIYEHPIRRRGQFFLQHSCLQ
jgi:hypothetical protein